MQARERSGKKSGFWGWFWSKPSNLSIFEPESWVWFFVLLGMASTTIVGMQALNGRRCAPGFNALNPESYVRRLACFAHWGTKNIPANFNEDPGLRQQTTDSSDPTGGVGDGNIVRPPVYQDGNIYQDQPLDQPQPRQGEYNAGGR